VRRKALNHVVVFWRFQQFCLLILILTVALAPLAAEAQQAGKVPRVGMLMPVSPVAASYNIETFRRGLAERGYSEGQNIALESRFADGRVEPLADLAAELVRLNVDVIVTWGTPAAHAAKRATQTIPIVMAAVAEPVATGLVASLARPGGNVTGVSFPAEMSAKNVELLKEIVPKVSRVALLWNPDNQVHRVTLREVQRAAGIMAVQLQPLAVRDPREFDAAFVAMMRERAYALIVANELLFLAHRTRIVDLVAKSRLPATYSRREWAEAGGLMSYGPSFRDSFRRAAAYVDKILKGAKPADLPVEQPTKLELVINLKTAKELGLAIPPLLLLRADQVIE